MPEIENAIHPKTIKEWRKWLEKNHQKEKRVFLIKYKKHTGKPTFTHNAAMREAICFGWIDTTVKRLDHDRYGHFFVRRGENAGWSNNTLRYAKEMVKEGKMSSFGMKRYKQGLKKTTIDHGLPKNPELPKELKNALAKNKKAKTFFDGLAPSYRRFHIIMVSRAVRPETKQKRVKEIIQKCLEGKKQ